MTSKGGWRPRLTLIGCLAAVGLLFALPTPRAATPTGRAGAGSPPLSSRWPGAAVVTIPAHLDDGSQYTPLWVLDPATSIGTAVALDHASIYLVLVDGTGQRRLATLPGGEIPGTFPAVTADPTHVYWAQTVQDTAGYATTSLWSADRHGAGTRELTADAGRAVFYRSQYDLQLVADRLTWLASDGTGTEIRSLPATGGPTAVRAVPGGYAPAGWPWLTNAGTGAAGPTVLFNVDTGARQPVRSGTGTVVGCGPHWCRVQTGGTVGGPAQLDLIHPDGTGRRVLGGRLAAPLVDVALLDRFELLGVAQATSTANGLQQLLLYDIRDGRTVELAPTSTGSGAAGGWVWWSTGDNDTMTWHALALSSLA